MTCGLPSAWACRSQVGLHVRVSACICFGSAAGPLAPATSNGVGRASFKRPARVRGVLAQWHPGVLAKEALARRGGAAATSKQWSPGVLAKEALARRGGAVDV